MTVRRKLKGAPGLDGDALDKVDLNELEPGSEGFGKYAFLFHLVVLAHIS
jgi:hypothetical protein